METIFRKVSVKERLPNTLGEYYETSNGKQLLSESGKFSWSTDYWFEKIPLPEIMQEKEREIERLKSDELSSAADEREVFVQAFDKITKEFEGRNWIMEGRGCYPYNDDGYKQEVRYIFDTFNQIKDNVWKSIKSRSFEYRDRVIQKACQEKDIQIQELKEDVIGFPEWKESEGFTKICHLDNDDNGSWYDEFTEGINRHYFTTEQLYTKYKDSKKQ